MKGVIEHLKERYGFIAGEDMKSYFFIPTSMERTTTQFEELRRGMKVEFTPIAGDRGPRAIEVRVVGAPSPSRPPIGRRHGDQNP